MNSTRWSFLPVEGMAGPALAAKLLIKHQSTYSRTNEVAISDRVLTSPASSDRNHAPSFNAAEGGAFDSPGHPKGSAASRLFRKVAMASSTSVSRSSFLRLRLAARRFDKTLASKFAGPTS